MTDAPLLPARTKPFSVTLEAAGAARFPALNGAPLESLVNPNTIPSAFLPWLAWQMGVAIWNDGWSDAYKRWVIANAVAFAKSRGTRAGFDAYLGLVGGAIVGAVVPPGKTFLSPAMTPAQRAAYLALFPQLRVYPYVAGVQNLYSTFVNVAFGLPKAFLTRIFPATAQATERYTRTSEIVYPNGTVTQLTQRTVTPEVVGSISATTYDEIALPPKPSRQIFPKSAFLQKQPFGSPFDPTSIIRVPVTTTWSFSEPRVTIETAAPGLALIDTTPTDVAQVHTKQSGQPFPSGATFLNGLYTPPSIAWQNVYQQFFLFDPTVVPPVRNASTFLAWTRLGQPAYTAELQVSIDRTISPGEAWRFVSGYLRTPQQGAQQISDLCFAARVAKSARDEILIKTKTVRPVQFSDGVAFGGLTFGGWVPASP